MNTIRRLKIACAAALFATLTFAGAVSADEVADFYRGKTISLYIGFGVGGGYDTYSRVLARHWGNHIPGKPTVVPKNMPGAGGLKVANFLYNAAPRNGTQAGVFASSVALEPLFGGTKAKFESTKFTWIGNMNPEIFACGVWNTSGVKKFSDMLNKEVIFGSTGKAAITSQHARVLKNQLGAKLRIIYGYKGTKGINLAMRRGEVNGSCGLSLSTVQSRWDRDIAEGKLKVIIQFGRKSLPEFGDATNIYDLAKDEKTKQVFDVLFQQGELGRPVAATPAIPKARAAALQKGFLAAMKSAGLRADAKKAKLPIDPSGAKEAVALLNRFYAMPKPVINAAKKIIGRK